MSKDQKYGLGWTEKKKEVVLFCHTTLHGDVDMCVLAHKRDKM